MGETNHSGPAWFVTGTDTEIGKTLVSASLVLGLSAKGLPTLACKPIAAGLEDDGVNADVRLLQQACAAVGLPCPIGRIGPIALKAACAPNVAAHLEGQRLSAPLTLPFLQTEIETLRSQASALVVEGVGGFRVPLDDDWDTADLAVALGLPVILVVGLRLGCLNHALLTAEAILNRGLPMAGWVANTIDPTMLALDKTFETLEQALSQLSNSPCLGRIPRLADAAPLDRARAAVQHLHLQPLLP